MHLCYIDESGTPDLPGNTSHYILAGLAMPVQDWKQCDGRIEKIKEKYELKEAEIHTAWILRAYREQSLIPKFEQLDYSERRSKVESHRKAELLRLQAGGNNKKYHRTKKLFKQTQSYIHLTREERRQFIKQIAKEVCSWKFSRLFAECIDKVHFDPQKAKQDVLEQSFEQLISRFDQYMQAISRKGPDRVGLLIHDNNPTAAKKLTLLMKKYHQKGTRWTKLKHIIETPLFVSSELTGMVQVADVCGYALRRYLENQENELFDIIFKRADRKFSTVVGVRHFSSNSCCCKICDAHKPKSPAGRLLGKLNPIKQEI